MCDPCKKKVYKQKGTSLIKKIFEVIVSQTYIATTNNSDNYDL